MSKFKQNVGYYEVRTKKQVIVAHIVRGKGGFPQLRVCSNIPFKFVKIDCCYLFDMLAKGMNPRSKMFAVKRRAFQLNGYSLQSAMEKL